MVQSPVRVWISTKIHRARQIPTLGGRRFFDRLLKWLSPDELEALSLLHLDTTVLVAKKG
jgi:hypothetical protein